MKAIFLCLACMFTPNVSTDGEVRVVRTPVRNVVRVADNAVTNTAARATNVLRNTRCRVGNTLRWIVR
jgi:hypothetical protein